MIKIKNLRLKTIIGVYEHERNEKQDIILNIHIQSDLSIAARSDNLADTLDYDALTKKIISTVESSSYRLIEALAQAVLDIIADYDEKVSAFIEIEKPNAIPLADSVSVVMARNSHLPHIASYPYNQKL